jgi:hypothetical protein
MNSLSTSGHEDIFTYAPFDKPMGEMLSSIRTKEMNLMLHDLAREQELAIVDVDAIAADIGAAAHLPDGVHQSGLMQAEIRAEILRILSQRGVRGFAAGQITSKSTRQILSPSSESGIASSGESLSTAKGQPTFSQSPDAHSTARRIPG